MKSFGVVKYKGKNTLCHNVLFIPDPHTHAYTHTHTAQSRNHSGVPKMPIHINTGNCIEYKTVWRRARGQCNIVDQRKLFFDAHSGCTKSNPKCTSYCKSTRSPPGVTKRAIKVPELFSILGRFWRGYAALWGFVPLLNLQSEALIRRCVLRQARTRTDLCFYGVQAHQGATCGRIISYSGCSCHDDGQFILFAGSHTLEYTFSTQPS